MKLYKAHDRAYLYSRKEMYLRRREEMREKYGMYSPEYKEKVKKLNRGIRRYSRAMVEIDKRNIQLRAIGNYLCLFMGVNVKDSNRKMQAKYKIARHLFYKYGIEIGIPGILLSEYVGAHQNTAAKGRQNFTRSFSTHAQNRDIWQRWKRYIEDIETTN